MLGQRRAPYLPGEQICQARDRRVRQIVRHAADGGFVHPAAVDHIFYERLRQRRDKVLQYQLIQHDYDQFELRLAMTDRAAFDRVAPGYVAEIRGLLGTTATVEAVYSPERLPTGPGGKFRPCLSLLEQQPP